MIRGIDDVVRNLEAWGDETYRKAYRAMEEIAAILEGYAKTHHPWTPRTGATDVSTKGMIAEATEHFITLYLTAGMDYNVFLELCHEGRWAWLYPAIEANLELIKQKLDEIVGSGAKFRADIGVTEA